MPIKDINELLEEDKQVKKFIKQADMKSSKNVNKKVGAPVKKKEDLATEQVLAKVTLIQKEQITKRGKELGFRTTSSFIIFSLGQQGAL